VHLLVIEMHILRSSPIKKVWGIATDTLLHVQQQFFVSAALGYTSKKRTGRDHSICKSSERSVTVPFLCRLVLSSYAMRTKSSTLGMRLPFVLVADGLCPAFRHLIELYTTLRRPMPWDCRAEFESGRFCRFQVWCFSFERRILARAPGLKLSISFVASHT